MWGTTWFHSTSFENKSFFFFKSVNKSKIPSQKGPNLDPCVKEFKSIKRITEVGGSNQKV